MGTSAWKDMLRPTTADIDQATGSRALVLSIERTISAALFTLAEEGIILEVTEGQVPDGVYVGLMARMALTSTKQRPALSRAALAARLLGWCAAFLESAEGDEPDPIDHHQMMLAIGYHAGMLALDECGLFDVAGKALTNRQRRGDRVRERNLSKTAWHEPALALAKRHRETFPHRATETIASVIDGDSSIGSPGHTQILTTLRGWEKDGLLPRRKLAAKK